MPSKTSFHSWKKWTKASTTPVTGKPKMLMVAAAPLELGHGCKGRGHFGSYHQDYIFTSLVCKTTHVDR